MKIHLLLSLTLLFSAAAQSAYRIKAAEAASLSIEQLQQDFDLFRRSLEEGHPGIYRYTTRHEMDRIFSRANHAITRQLSLADFYRILAHVLAAIKCGHSELFPPRSSPAEIEKTILPIDVRVIDGRLYILHDYDDNRDTLAGNEMLSVNGVPANRLLATILQAVPGDANGKSTRTYRIGHDRGFARMLDSMFEIRSPFFIVYRNSITLKTKEAQVLGLSEGRITRIVNSRQGSRPSPFASAHLEFLDGGKIAVLKIYGFGGMAGKPLTSLGKFIDDAFRRIHDSRSNTLIIDVRDNDGGQHELGERLFSYLVDKPFLYYRDLILNARSFSFMPYADSSESIQENVVTLGKDGKYHHTGQANWGTQLPREPHFNGKVIVLMNGGSFSATSEFLAMTRSLTKATLIGEESGGAFQGNNSGLKYDITLPNSKIVLRMPVVSYCMAVQKAQPMDRGVLPDVMVHYSIAEMVSRTDKEMGLALKLASRGTRPRSR